jgi:hypothetical protein
MDQFKLAIAMMAVTDSHWGPCDAHGRRREFSAAELDALADFGWHLPEVMSRLAAWAQAMRSRWRPRASEHLDPMPLPAPAATTQG